MIDHLWQSTLFALVIAAMVPLFRRQSAGIRFWLWFAASVKFLVPLALLVKLGGYLPALPAPAKALIAPASRTFAAPIQIAPPAPGLPVAEILIAVWVLGALFVAGLWLMRWMNLRAVLRGADDLAMAPPLSAPVPVKLVASYLEPGLVGIFRPVILMPRGVAEKLSPPEMRAVLAHELSHHHRRDNLLACAQMLVEMLFWFHPLVWWIGGRLIAERERACDEAVLEHNAPRTYAEGILKICRFHLQPALACTAGVSGGDLKTRVRAIMADQRRHELDGQRILLLGSLGLVTVMLPLLAGAPGSAPVNRLAQQVARVLAAPALPQMHFTPVSAAKPRRAAPVVVPPVIAGPALPVAETPPPLVDSTPPSQTVVVTQLRAAPPVLEDETVCRKPQKIAGSRLLGPPVCLRASTWAEMAAQGRDIGADGRSIVPSASSFEKRASINPAACLRAANNSASGGAMLPRIACF